MGGVQQKSVRRMLGVSPFTAAVLVAFFLQVPASASLAQVAARSSARVASGAATSTAILHEERRATGSLTLAAARNAQRLQSSSGLLRQLLERSAAVALAAPLPNDTISAAYWSKVDQAIAEAAATTISPDALATTVAPEAWARVFGASRPDGEVSAEDLTPEEAAARAAQETPSGLPPGTVMSTGIAKQQSLVPYDMQIGARIMYGLTPKNTPTPPPLQGTVSEQFVAQCPMIMFAKNLHISAPTCGNRMGMWEDPSDKRVVLRWKPGTRGGVNFGVDSSVRGPGSVTYAEMKQELSMSGVYFELTNCLKVKRYTVQEEVVQVDHIGLGVTSSAQEHDISRTGVAYFYKYKIFGPNGTLAAESNLFRQNQDDVNITSYVDEISTGPVIARAQRIGNWKSSDWRQCSASERAWQVDFSGVSSRDMETVATVQDLRVAAAAVITLMAFRDEAVTAENGQNRSGELSILKQMFSSLIIVVLVIAIFGLMVMFIRRKGWDARMRRCCFKVEAVFLPKRPAWTRSPPFNPTY